MNTKRKGASAELEFQKLLESQGLLVERVKGATKFAKSVDFFGAFDLIAIGADGVRLIQVKSNSTQGCLKKLREWRQANHHTPPKFERTSCYED